MTPFIPLIRSLAKQLTARHKLLSTAESCTGGLLSGYLTAVPGSSLWFERGFVTYSNLAKQEMLGVSPDLLTTWGAVSEPVASAMALGALKHSAGDVAVAVTGIAGPEGGSESKPVGTVCFGFAAQALPVQTLQVHFTGTREAIRLSACKQAIEGVLSFIQ